nr:hypothetical protein [Borreliella bissettiae]
MTKAFNDDIRCNSCNRLIRKYDETCVACGAKNRHNKKLYYSLISFSLCLFFGYLGLYSLYLGKNPKISYLFLFISMFAFLLAVLLHKTNKTIK